MESNVGFITPDNKIIYLTYDELEGFCIDVCYLDENYQEWLEFDKDYTYFSSYFDFLILHLNYIFINPLLQNNTYLKSEKNKMFIIDKNDIDKISYDSISEAAKNKYNGGVYADIVPCSNQELNIKKIPDNDIKIGNCLVDPNGYSIISKSCECVENHEATANTVLNQLLIKTQGLYKLFTSSQYAVSFLIENFGFLRVVTYDEYNYSIIVGYQRILSDTVLRIKEEIIKNSINVFYDWDSENDNLPLESQKYNIKCNDERTKYYG